MYATKDIRTFVFPAVVAASADSDIVFWVAFQTAATYFQGVVAYLLLVVLFIEHTSINPTNQSLITKCTRDHGCTLWLFSHA